MSELFGSDAYAPREIAERVETVGVAKARMATLPLLMLGVLAGAFIGLGSLLLFMCSAEGLPALPVERSFWLATVYLVLGCTVFAFFAQNWALQHSSPSRVALLTSAEPAFGVVFAVLWLGEGLGVTAWIGGGLIVLAALWTTARRG